MMAKIIKKRMTAEIEGEFVIFLIGVRINKPWLVHKWWSPVVAMPRMLKELEQHPEKGLLGYHLHLGFPVTMVVQYWRSFEQLADYAGSRDAQHWPAWVAFNKQVGSGGSVGIWHETYRVAGGAYETVYNNMPEYGLGRAGNLETAVGRKSTAAGRIQASRNTVE